MQMTTEEFYIIWCNKWLRQRLIDCARAYTDDRELQEDCLQEAWFKISMLHGDASEGLMLESGKRAIDACRKRWQRPWRGRRERQIRGERKMRRVTVRLTGETVEELDAIAQEMGCSVSALIRKAVYNVGQHRVPIGGKDIPGGDVESSVSG
jgi:hypothetical protein